MVVRPWFGKLSRLSIPYSTLVETVARQEGDEPAMVIVADKLLGGNVRTRLHGAKVFVPGNTSSPPIEHLAGPLLVVWSDNGKLDAPPPQGLLDFLRSFGVPEAAMKPQQLALPYLNGNLPDRYGFGYFWIADPSRSAPTSSLSSPG